MQRCEKPSFDVRKKPRWSKADRFSGSTIICVDYWTPRNTSFIYLPCVMDQRLLSSTFVGYCSTGSSEWTQLSTIRINVYHILLMSVLTPCRLDASPQP